jgi:hypothetical protein
MSNNEVKNTSNSAINYLEKKLLPVTKEKFQSFLKSLIIIDTEYNQEFDMKNIIYKNISNFNIFNYSNSNFSIYKKTSNDSYRKDIIKSLDFNFDEIEKNEYYYEMGKYIFDNFLLGINSPISSTNDISLFIKEIFNWFFENVV